MAYTLKDLTNKRCTACGVEQTETTIGYTREFVPYCFNQFDCTSVYHINSQEQIEQRGSLVHLLRTKEIRDLAKKSSSIDASILRIIDQASRPIAFRETDFDRLQFLYDIGKGNISEGIRVAVQYMMERERDKVPNHR